MPASSDLSEVDDDDIKPIRSKGKGKAKATIQSDSDSEQERKMDYEDDKDQLGDSTDDEDIKEEVGKVRAIARALKGESKKPIEGAKAKEVGKSITRLLKGKGKASPSTSSNIASATSPHFEIVIPSRPNSSAAKPKSKGKEMEVIILSSGDESVFEPDVDMDEDEQDELDSENDSEQSVKLAMLLALGSDLDSDEDAESLGAKLEKMAKKPRVKAVTRKGATLSKDVRASMKKMTKVGFATLLK